MSGEYTHPERHIKRPVRWLTDRGRCFVSSCVRKKKDYNNCGKGQVRLDGKRNHLSLEQKGEQK